MNIRLFIFLWLSTLLLVGLIRQEHDHPTDSVPSLFFADAECMQSVRKEAASDSGHLNDLYQEARKVLPMSPVSVMDKSRIPPSGDKHDYISQGPYWWPDPNSPNGLPYIRRDGEVNPERNTFQDKENLSRLIDWTDALGKAYFFSKDEQFAEKAAELIRSWFLLEASRMNPNLNYGQGIPGRTDGRGIGIIETRSLGLILDTIHLIRASEHWTDEDEAGMQAWCNAYLDWLLTSQHGQDESVHPNNHGTWYDVQAGALAVFTNQDSIARRLCLLAKHRRLDAHIDSVGQQPRELARTRSWDYSCMNLLGLFRLAMVAEQVGVDLWHYPTTSDSKLRQALLYLLPFALEEKTWLHQQIRTLQPEKLIPHLEIASRVYSEESFQTALRLLTERHPYAGGLSCY